MPSWAQAIPDNTLANKVIHQFLAESFARKVEVNSEHEYKISIAISEKLLEDIHIQEKNDSMPKDEKFGGIIYPTLSMSADADNIVLLPKFVDKYLELIFVEYYSVESAIPDIEYKIRLLDFANSFTKNHVEWKGRPPEWTLPAGSLVSVAEEHGRFVVRNAQGQIILPS